MNIYPARGHAATLKLKRADDAGHGTLGRTHGAGSGQALAELISGKRPALAFGFCGDERVPRRRPVATTRRAARPQPQCR